MEPAEDIAGLWDYLRDRLDRYAQPAAPAGLGPDATLSARHDYDRPATFLLADMVYPCHVTEILADGLSFRSEIAPPPGSRPRLSLPYLGQFDCQVIASAPEKVDARFVIDEDRRAELLVQVAALLASGREPPVSAAAAETTPEAHEPGAMSGIAR